MSELRGENSESLSKINGIVTEKMQKTLDEKFNGAFETVVKNMSEIGKTLDAGQKKLQKATSEKLEGLENDFDKINTTVNEKLQKTLDEKLNGMSETVVKNMSELGKRLEIYLQNNLFHLSKKLGLSGVKNGICYHIHSSSINIVRGIYRWQKYA